LIAFVVVTLTQAALFTAHSIYRTGTTIYRPDKAWSGYTVFDTPNEQGATPPPWNRGSTMSTDHVPQR
jgi:hypothetical protein